MADRNIIIRNIIYCVTLGIALFMHFYRLADVPYGIHIDEAGMAYDAYCLANYSVDRYLNRLPVYLVNFGDGQSALYAYLTALLVKLSGDINLWVIRIPGAAIGMCGWIAGVGIIQKCMGEKWGMAASFLLAVFPYFSMQSRFGLDCNLLSGISTVGIYLLLLAEEKGEARHFIIAGAVWGICYYTYALSYIGSTLFLASVLLYWLWNGRIGWKNCLCFGIPVLLLAAPLLLMVIINSKGMESVKIAWFTVPALPKYRGSELVFDSLWENFRTAWKSILTRDWIPYNALVRYYTMYRISIPFAVAGAAGLVVKSVRSFRRRTYSVDAVFAFLLCSWVFVGMVLGGDGPNINKLNGIFFALFYCVLFSMRQGYRLLKRFSRMLPQALAVLLALLYAAEFVSFADFYFHKYPEEPYPQFLFADTYEDIMEFVETETGEPKVVYTDASYIYYFLGGKVDPYEAGMDGINVESYWKYVFHLPDDIMEDCIYIVRETNRDYIARLKEYPFEVYHSGMYDCFYIDEEE